MCVDQELSERHERRLQQKNRSRTSRTINRMKVAVRHKRGHISVPLVLAAIDEDVIDALGPVKILGNRLPQVVEPVPSLEEARAPIYHRRHEDEQVRMRWLAENPFPGLSAA